MGRGRNIAICIGAKKAGTTWLYQCLREHPEVDVSPIKEPHYFSKRYEVQSFEDYLETIEFDDAKINYESSVSYLAHPEAPKRVAKHVPHARLLVILRDPVQRAFSEYQHLLSQKAIHSDISVKEAAKEVPQIVENSFYYKHLSRYLEHFSREQMHIMCYEDIEKDPQAFIDEICTFLGIEYFTPSILNVKYHSSQARSNRFYFTAVKMYKKIQKHLLGRKLIALLKMLGMRGTHIDTIMQKTAKKNVTPSADDEAFLRKQIEQDKQALTQLFGSSVW